MSLSHNTSYVKRFYRSGTISFGMSDYEQFRVFSNELL